MDFSHAENHFSKTSLFKYSELQILVKTRDELQSLRQFNVCRTMDNILNYRIDNFGLFI